MRPAPSRCAGRTRRRRPPRSAPARPARCACRSTAAPGGSRGRRVEHDHAVLLAADRDRLDVVEAAGLRDRFLQRLHQAAGSTSVPSGCDARPERTSAPVASSRITTLQLWVEESTPATSVISVLPSARRAQQVFGGELLQPHEAVALGAEVGVRVEVLPGRAVGEQLRRSPRRR